MKPDLKRRLAKANDVVAPDLWEEIGTRVTRGIQLRAIEKTAIGGRQRIAAAVVAFAVFAFAAAFAWTALRPVRRGDVGPAANPSLGGLTLLVSVSGPNGDQALLRGELGSTGGCLSVSGEIVIWPRGYQLVDQNGTTWVIDGDGVLVTPVTGSVGLGGSATNLPVANRLVPGGVPASCQAAQADTPDPFWLAGGVQSSSAPPTATGTVSSPPVGLTGTLIVAAGDHGSSQLYSYDLRTGATLDLGAGRDPAVSPDGTRIAFRIGNAYRPGGNPMQIGVMNVDGTNVQVRDVSATLGAEPLGAGAPVWSPDGSRIAFAAFAGIYTMRPDGGDLRKVSHFGGSCYDLEPAWAPDGSKLVFAVRCGGGNQGIWSVNLDGTNRRQLAVPGDNGIIDYRYPSWSPDGTSLTFEGVSKVENPHGYSYDTYLMGPNGAVTRISRASCERPVWSPDGRWIECTSGQVTLVRPDGSEETTLTPVPGQFVTSVAWVPNAGA